MRRGPYLNYLKDDLELIPRQTQRDRALRLEHYHNPGGNDEQQENELNQLSEEELCNDDAALHENMEVENQSENEIPNDESDIEIANEEVENEEDNDEEPVELEDLHHGAHEAEGRETIYPGCSLTKDESDLLLMSFVIRHGITDAALTDLLQIINCHLPRPYISSSKYQFLKSFPSIVTIKTFYYCPECYVFLNFEGLQQQRNTNCPSCHICYYETDLNRSGHFFVHIPLKEQLKKLLSGPLFHKLQRDCAEPEDVISDINSGKAYKTLKSQQVVSDLDITIQWNADGVDTFKSSKVSMWPIQVSINELPYRIRKEHILLASLWCAAEKPVLDLYLKPFVDDLRDLHENGFDCLPPDSQEPVNIKVHTILAPVDSVARCALQNIHQFNGEFGCSLCLNPGEHVRVGNGFARVYRGGEGPPRTKEQHRRGSERAVVENTVVNGVKGISLLMLLPIFNIIASFTPEYMHAVLLGVVKLFMLAWFDPKNSDSAWYINAEKKKIFDQRLTRILPPCEITRVPRSISDIKLWKASEFKNFLLYYSLPCLKDLLPMPYYKHWSLLVFAMHKLLAEKITSGSFAQAEIAIRKFVHEIETLYGKELMKFNVHLLLHIPRSVKYFGALWAWSAFSYESYNYILRSILHSSRYVLKQVCKSYLRFQSIKFNNTFNKRNCSPVGRTLFLKMVGKIEVKCSRTYEINDSRLKIFGTGNPLLLNLVQKLSIEALLDESIKENAVQSFQRFMFKKTIYHSYTYEKIYKRDNSIIKTIFGTLMTIAAIFSVTTRMTGEKKFIIVGRSFEILDDILCSNNNISSASYSYAVRLTNNILTCLPEQISNKCIMIPGENSTKYIMPLVNTIETD